MGGHVIRTIHHFAEQQFAASAWSRDAAARMAVLLLVLFVILAVLPRVTGA